jgi:hypothetical protein
MNELVPKGYISIREALDRIGRQLFHSDWIGGEHKARSGLLSPDEWSVVKDLPPARGSGATGSGTMLRETGDAAVARVALPVGDPSDPSYQEEYKASRRYADACHELRVKLEAGDLEAAVLDPWSGTLHAAPTRTWRRRDAGRIIKAGRAPIPGSRNTGSLLIKDFPEVSAPIRPASAAKIRDIITALQNKTATERLTRSQQKDFIREKFPTCRITERQFINIFRSIAVTKGRPKKPDNKV